MPHDKNGALVNAGDTVTVEFVVSDVQTGTEYCNATLVSVEPMYPGEHKSSITINTKQAVKIGPVKEEVKLGDGKILELLIKYGPFILALFGIRVPPLPAPPVNAKG